MAQRNRRRARSAGPGPRSGNGNGGLDHARVDPALASGEESLAEAQLAFGRPAPEERPSAEELTAFEEADATASRPSLPAPAESSAGLLARTTGFLQGSWRELQRVQWPDRRQVFQATGVVLGFVIVAGAFLGVASFAAQKIVNLILYGHG